MYDKFKDFAKIKSLTVETVGMPGRGTLCSSDKSTLKPSRVDNALPLSPAPPLQLVLC